MKATKKQYSAAEKTKIALEAIRGELTTAQIAVNMVFMLPK